MSYGDGSGQLWPQQPEGGLWFFNNDTGSAYDDDGGIFTVGSGTVFVGGSNQKFSFIGEHSNGTDAWAKGDIIQVGYFKLTHGKRVFKMSPFHHHLEMGGWTGHKWKETQIVALFAGVTVLFAVLSFIGVFHRFDV